MLSQLRVLLTSTSRSNMTHGATQIALNSFRVSALWNKMITLSAAETFAAQSDASVPFSSTARSIGMVGRAVSLVGSTSDGRRGTTGSSVAKSRTVCCPSCLLVFFNFLVEGCKSKVPNTPKFPLKSRVRYSDLQMQIMSLTHMLMPSASSISERSSSLNSMTDWPSF